MDIKNRIARRIAKEIKDGDIVNCGIGIPTLVPNYVPPDCDVTFHSENGVLGVGPSPPLAEADLEITNAGRRRRFVSLASLGRRCRGEAIVRYARI